MPRRRQPSPEPAPSKPTRRRPGSGSVIVRGDGRVAVVLPADLAPDRKPIYGPAPRQPFASPAEAGRWLDAEIVRRRNPTPAAASAQERVGAYLVRWHQDNAPSLGARTALGYRRALRHWRPLADVLVGDLTRELVQGAVAQLQTGTWRRKRRDGGRLVPYGPAMAYKASTIKTMLAVLQTALEGLVPHVLPYNPARKVRLARVQPAPQPVWDAEQAGLFLATAERDRPDLYLGWLLIFRRALRRGEVLALLVSDVDERRRVLVVDDTAGVRAGETGDTKGRRVREIPLSDELLAAVRTHRKRQADRPSRWLFPGRQAGKPLSMHAFGDATNRVTTAAKLPKITPKDMRATAATILLDQNVSLARVSRLLGHSSVAVTAQFYERSVRATPERVSQLADEFDAAFTRAAETAKTGAPAPFSDAKVSGNVSTREATR